MRKVDAEGLEHGKMKPCEEKCPKDQPEHLCSKCRSCLYKAGKWIPNEMYPLFECLACGEVNFWD